MNVRIELTHDPIEHTTLSLSFSFLDNEGEVGTYLPKQVATGNQKTALFSYSHKDDETQQEQEEQQKTLKWLRTNE